MASSSRFRRTGSCCGHGLHCEAHVYQYSSLWGRRESRLMQRRFVLTFRLYRERRSSLVPCEAALFGVLRKPGLPANYRWVSTGVRRGAGRSRGVALLRFAATPVVSAIGALNWTGCRYSVSRRRLPADRRCARRAVPSRCTVPRVMEAVRATLQQRQMARQYLMR